MSHTCARGHNVTVMSSALPHGSWPTPITSERVVRAAARLGELVVDGDDVWWSESRPTEAGRSAIVRRSPDGTITDVLEAPWNARTRVHEYGGGAWTVSGGTLWFTEFGDQRLYRLDAGTSSPVAVTAEPPVPAGVRYADLRVTADGLLAVRETHPEGGGPADVVNELVRIADSGKIEVLVSGPDFVSDLRPAPDGRSLAWLQWNHPDMPWDAAQLVVRGPDGTDTVVAGGPGESVVQPEWAADGSLLFLCDRTDVWSLYRWRPDGSVETVLDAGCDIAGPQWIFGQSRYALLDDGRIALTIGRDGADRLAVLSRDGELREFDLPYGTFRYVAAQGSAVVCPAGGPSSEPVVLRVDVDSGRHEVLRPARDLGLDPGWFSRPEHVTFPTADAGTGIDVAHALVYPPANPSVTAPDGAAAAAAGGRARRADLRRHARAQPRRPVLDLPGVLRRRRRLPRLDGLRPSLPRRAARADGAWWTSTTSSPAHASSPTPGGWTPPAWRSAAARRAGTRPWRR